MVVVALPTLEEDPDDRIRALEREKRELADRLERKDREAEVQRARADSYAMQLSTERERIKSVIVDLENSEVALRVERRRRSAAEEKLKRMAEEEVHPALGQIREVFEYWRAECRGGNARVVLGEKRSAVIAARLKDGYTVDQLCQAIDGARDHAFEKDGRKYDELELIMRNEVKVDDFIQRAMGGGGSAAAAPVVDRPPPRPPSAAQEQRRLDLQRLIDALVDHWGGLDACIPDGPRDQELWPCPKCTAREQVGLLYPLTVHLNHGSLAECSGCGVTGDQLLQAIE
jgi:hypothetical protein